jgi:hypothetical protein
MDCGTAVPLYVDGPRRRGTRLLDAPDDDIGVVVRVNRTRSGEASLDPLSAVNERRC